MLAMPKVSLAAIVAYCDRILKTSQIQDYDKACNGLQVENSGHVSQLAAAVDGSLATVQKAVDAKADLLLVHHGLFWGASHPWTKQRRQLIQLLVEHDMAVYSSHLPLDVHPRFGNNARLCAAMGLTKLNPFFPVKGQLLGFRSRAKITRSQLVRRLQEVTGTAVRVLPGGSEQCRDIGVVTGGAGAELALAAAGGVDTFITGEGPHWTYALAEEYGINVLYGGHYATETFGVKALAAHLAQRYKLPWTFVDHPTGL
jgi:dinuclear metal center YbgI/SA1388 family protein